MSWSWLGFPTGFMPAFATLVPGEHGGEPFALSRREVGNGSGKHGQRVDLADPFVLLAGVGNLQRQLQRIGRNRRIRLTFCDGSSLRAPTVRGLVNAPPSSPGTTGVFRFLLRPPCGSIATRRLACTSHRGGADTVSPISPPRASRRGLLRASHFDAKIAEEAKMSRCPGAKKAGVALSDPRRHCSGVGRISKSVPRLRSQIPDGFGNPPYRAP